jgi:hypothetical protein
MSELEIQTTNADEFSKHLNPYKKFLTRMGKDSTKEHVVPNMDDTAPAGLLYLIEEARDNARRWTKDKGQIDLLYDLEIGSIVGISAVEHSNLHPDYASGGNRLWMDKDYRLDHNITKYLLTANLNWADANKKTGMILTFNDYNKAIWEIICKNYKKGDPIKSVSNMWSNWWNDCVPLAEPIIVHNTTQWAVIKPCTYFSLDQLKQDASRIQREYKT